jgi:hypothetical protein
MTEEQTPSTDELDETELQDATNGAEELPDRQAMSTVTLPGDSLKLPPVVE